MEAASLERLLRVDRSDRSGRSQAEGRARLTEDRRRMRAEDQLGLVLVVAPAAKRDVGDGGRPLHRIRLDVVELQERALRASPSRGGLEGALASVALPD